MSYVIRPWSGCVGCVLLLLLLKLAVLQVGSVCGHAASVNKLCFTAQGQELVTASDDHKIKVCSSSFRQ